VSGRKTVAKNVFKTKNDFRKHAMKTRRFASTVSFICVTAAMLLFTSYALGDGMITAIATKRGEKLPEPNEKQIEFRIGFDCDLKTIEKTAKDTDEYITIYCSWRNISKKSVSLLLKDHDSYHGQLDYPFGITIKITNSKGVVLTETQFGGEWWNNQAYWSQTSNLMPGDIITLKPNKRVIRSFKVDDILMGLTSKQAEDKAPRGPDGVIDMTKVEVSDFKMPKGKNRIEVQCWGGMIATNSLILNIE